MNLPRTFVVASLLILIFGLTVLAQRPSESPSPSPTPTPCGKEKFDILIKNPYKIKVEQAVSSSTARRDDYVQFTTLEDVYSVAELNCPTKVLIEKGTSIYGRVVIRKHRHFPLVNGRLEIKLLPIKTWDATLVHVDLRRHLSDGNNWKDTCKSLKDSRKEGNCIAGRRNAVVAPIVPAIAATGGGAVSLIAEDTTSKVLGATAFFTLAEKVGDLLNGTDAALGAGEILDMYIRGDETKPIPPLIKKEK